MKEFDLEDAVYVNMYDVDRDVLYTIARYLHDNVEHLVYEGNFLPNNEENFTKLVGGKDNFYKLLCEQSISIDIDDYRKYIVKRYNEIFCTDSLWGGIIDGDQFSESFVLHYSEIKKLFENSEDKEYFEKLSRDIVRTFCKNLEYDKNIKNVEQYFNDKKITLEYIAKNEQFIFDNIKKWMKEGGYDYEH